MADNKKKYRWEDEEIDQLINLYEERPCLQDIADKSYQKRDIKERALSEISEELDIETAAIKSKQNSLRTQHGRELAKENKTKSGQNADDFYDSTWPFMGKMRSIEQIKKTAISTSTIKTTNKNGEAEVNVNEDVNSQQHLGTPIAKGKQIKRKRKQPCDEKQKLITKCIDILDKPSVTTQPLLNDPFAAYVSLQLNSLDTRRRLIAEKQMNDILHELRIEELVGNNDLLTSNSHSSTRLSIPMQSVQKIQSQLGHGSYTALLQDF